MRALRFSVADADAGARLDAVLARREEIGSRSLAERLLRDHAGLVDGTTRPKSHRLEAGSLVEVELPPAEVGLEPAAVSVPVVFEDEHVLVVDKPAGLVVHPGAGRAGGTLANALVGRAAGGEAAARPGIVHRLDRETSGLLVVAKSEEAFRGLASQIRRREVERRYVALVRGRPRSRSGRVEAPIGRDRMDPTRRSLDSDAARPAVTHFDVRELLPRHALLDVRLETGRTHQIRVHLAAIGLPVSGDRLYGVGGDLGLERQFLHAARLSFRHPVTGDPVAVESPLPPDLAGALERARSA